MPVGKPPKKPFKKGNPGGPGRPKKDPELAKAQKITRTQAEGLLTKFMVMNIDDLEAILKDRTRPVMEHIIGRICIMAIKTGDQSRLGFVLDRLIGKVENRVEIGIKPRVVHNLEGGAARFLTESDEDG